MTTFINGKKQINGYIMIKELGQGSFGEVFLAEKDNNAFAIKTYNHQKVQNNLHADKLKVMIDTEIEFLSAFEHPNIIKVYETFLSGNHLYLVMEYISGGDLNHQICKTDRLLPESEIVNLLSHITEAMYFASQQGIKHRDIKPENILIKGNQYILADFGVAKTSSAFSSTAVGTRPYMPPQILTQNDYTSKCDVWSLGITAYILLYGVDPFGRYEFDGKRLREVKSPKIDSKFCGKNLPFPSKPSISAGVKTILQKMLEYEEADRASWGQLKADLQNLTGDFNSESTAVGEGLVKY
jgi:serine/threonine protein kinase